MARGTPLSLVAGALAFLAAAPAGAATINSAFNFAGELSAVGTTGTLVGATGLDFCSSGFGCTFAPAASTLAGGAGEVIVTGNYPVLGLTFGETGVIRDLAFGAGGSVGPVTSFFVIDNFIFDLASGVVTPGTAQAPDGSGTVPTLAVTGRGVARLPGLEPTVATFTLTTQEEETGVVTRFSFSVVGRATGEPGGGGGGEPVPVPAALWLFGAGLLGLAGTSRFRRAA